MYIVFVMQCRKVQNKCQILLIIAESSVVLIVFNSDLCHISTYTVAISCHLLYMNQVSVKLY